MVNRSNITGLTIKEADKSDLSVTFFRPAPQQAKNSSLRTVLYAVNEDSTKTVFDGALQMFDNDFNNLADGADALKPSNIAEGFGIKTNGKELAIEKRKQPVAGDTIFYNMTKMRVRNYLLELEADNISKGNLTGYLVDNYTKSSVKLDMNGKTQLPFNVINEPGSYAYGRFSVVFKKRVNFGAVNALADNADALINWEVTDQNDIDRYEVESSADNIEFKQASTIQVNGKSQQPAYSVVDPNLAPGTYYYRIKAVGTDGEEIKSDVVKVKIMRADAPMYVFPNPVTDNIIRLRMNKQEPGYYSVKLLAFNGQLITAKVINYAGGSGNVDIQPGQKLAAGTYQVQVINPGKKSTVLKAAVK
ncbi:MAG: T9SS type A sorting domain-containing protein [Ferruginibacter sp.]